MRKKIGRVIAATFDSAQVWAELLLLEAKQNHGNNKEISPDKSKQAHHKLGMTIDITELKFGFESYAFLLLFAL